MLWADETAEVLHNGTYTPGAAAPKGQIPCYDPSTMQFLGHAKAMTPAEVGVLNRPGRGKSADTCGAVAGLRTCRLQVIGRGVDHSRAAGCCRPVMEGSEGDCVQVVE